MAVIFIVEDGSIITDANSYCTVEYFIQYWENRGRDFTKHPVPTIETLLIRATEKIDQNYNWQGTPYNTEQPLEWPRCGMYDSKGNDIDCDVIPDELKNACAAMAAYICDNGDPDDNEDGIKSKSIGPISVTYTNGGIVKVNQVFKALKSFIKQGAISVRV